MDSDVVLVVVVIVCSMLLVAVVTLGCVLLVRFLAAGFSAGQRIAAGAISGPITLLLPFLLLTVFDPSIGELLEIAIFTAVSTLMCLAVSWPTSHFATRRLDRLVHFDLEAFK